MSLREAIEDPYIWESSREGLEDAAMDAQIERLRLRSRRRHVEASVRSDRDGRVNRNSTTANQDDALGESCEDAEDEAYAMAAGVAAPTPPPFTVLTESDEESDENEEVPSAAILADRLRRESRWRTESDEDEDDLYRFPPPRRPYTLDTWESNSERRWRNERHLDPIRATRRQTPSRIEPKDGPSESEPLINPHAKFFIAKHKNKITIKFHPAM